MKDIQKTKPQNEINIKEVGIKRLNLPLIVMDKKNKHQQTVGTVSLSVNLPHNYRGTHMSRFVEILNKYIKKNISTDVLDGLTKEVLKCLQAEKSKVVIEFPYFVHKIAPISKKKSLLDYQCKFTRIAKKNISTVTHFIEIRIPISTVCPCSKEISKYGAHNQRGIVSVNLKTNSFIWVEDIIKIVENEASSPIYSLLKRPDEKYVTEKAYENPKFVEDIVRDISMKLMKNKKIDWLKVECENYESIHNHSAYAVIEKKINNF